MSPASGDSYRWEDSPGLSHHCGVCQRPLANPHALQSCIGGHVEPCRRFHQQLHFIKKSHDCSSCGTGVEMHRKRHREILTAIHLLKEEDIEAVIPLCGIASSKGMPPPRADKSTRKERKQLRKSAANSTRIPAAEIFTEADYVFVSEALYGKTTWGKSGLCEDDDPTSQHPREKQAKSESLLGGNRKYSKSENTRKRLRKAAGRDTSSPTSLASDPLLGVDRKIFQRLGVSSVDLTRGSRGRKEELKKLASTIAQDLAITEREDQELETRREGFYRFVNKRAITNLDELHQEFSWSTGEKKTLARLRA